MCGNKSLSYAQVGFFLNNVKHLWLVMKTSETGTTFFSAHPDTVSLSSPDCGAGNVCVKRRREEEQEKKTVFSLFVTSCEQRKSSDALRPVLVFLRDALIEMTQLQKPAALLWESTEDTSSDVVKPGG